MTTEYPEALRLADALDAVNTNNADSLLVQMAARSAAAELRRLHKENADFRTTIDRLTRENAGQIGEIVALKEQRDELLKALKGYDDAFIGFDPSSKESKESRHRMRQAVITARATIAKATGD